MVYQYCDNFFLTQISDIFIWHRPFVEMQEYFTYNLITEDIYPQGGFLQYIGVLLLLLVPPVSVFLLFGFFYGYKKLLLFLPSFIFLLFHSLFPNKQERFIFPIIPFIVILGIIGLYEFYLKNRISTKWRKIIRVCCIISLVVDIILLFPVTVHYSKKARVESMVYMYKYRPNVKVFIHEDSPHKDWEKMPKIYTVQNCQQINITSDTVNINALNLLEKPAFIMFAGDNDIEKRVNNMRKYFPNLEYATTINTSFLDELMRKINHHNHNYSFIIYRNNDVLHKLE